MRFLWSLLFLVPMLAFADGIAHSVTTPMWSLSAREHWGDKPPKNLYPIDHLMDGRPETTWVPLLSPTREGTGPDGETYSSINVTFESKIPFEVDEIRLMIGYQKSKELFYKNRRPLQMAIFFEHPWENDVPVRSVKLQDSMGWKSIRVPKKWTKQFTIRFSNFTKAQLNDVCVSELQLRTGGQPTFRLPKTYVYAWGEECGCSGLSLEVRRSPNDVIVAGNCTTSMEEAFSREKRYVAMGIVEDDRTEIVIVDLLRSQVVKRRRYSPKYKLDWMQWAGPRRIQWIPSIEVGEELREIGRRTLRF